MARPLPVPQPVPQPGGCALPAAGGEERGGPAPSRHLPRLLPAPPLPPLVDVSLCFNSRVARWRRRWDGGSCCCCRWPPCCWARPRLCSWTRYCRRAGRPGPAPAPVPVPLPQRGEPDPGGALGGVAGSSWRQRARLLGRRLARAGGRCRRREEVAEAGGAEGPCGGYEVCFYFKL